MNNVTTIAKKEMRWNLIAWLLALLSVATSYLLPSGLWLGLWGLAAFKYLLISFQFMELKQAHLSWQAWSVFLITAFAVGASVLG